MNKKINKGTLVILLMIGIFVTLVGVIGFIKGPEITDAVTLVSGLAITGFGIYGLVVPFEKK